ncbi:MAG: HXXEE domain-containing protein [Anaerolineae bacterium]|nr:HXXEE domain-containing protein [Anaerolineae bacterium]
MDDHNRLYLRYTQLMNGSLALFAVFVAVWILIDPTRRSDPDYVFWLVMAIGLLHTVEEYILPGGFVPWFNLTVCRSSEAFLPLSARRAFLTDGTAALFALPIMFLISAGILPVWAAFFIAMALYVNAFLHIGEWIKTARYSPGMLTSLLLIIPGYTWIFSFYLSRALVSPLHIAIAFVVGILMNAVFYAFLRKWSSMTPTTATVN